MVTNPQSFSLPFIKKEQLTKDCFSFYFGRTQAYFDFEPGQYIRMILPHDESDDRGTSRFFTIASPSNEKRILIVTTRIGSSTFKRALSNLSIGQEVSFWGPLGNFILDKETLSKPLVLLAGGMGITPYYSMLVSSALNMPTREITLIASFAKSEDFIYQDELYNLSQENKNLKIVYTITRDTHLSRWSGDKGRISKELLEKYAVSSGDLHYYICGPISFVFSIEGLLKEMHIDENLIKVEKYTGYLDI